MVGRLDDLGAGRTMSYINMDDFFQYRLKRSGTNKVMISRLGPEWDQLAKMVSSRPDYHFQQIFSVFTVSFVLFGTILQCCNAASILDGFILITTSLLGGVRLGYFLARHHDENM